MCDHNRLINWYSDASDGVHCGQTVSNTMVASGDGTNSQEVAELLKRIDFLEAQMDGLLAKVSSLVNLSCDSFVTVDNLSEVSAVVARTCVNQCLGIVPGLIKDAIVEAKTMARAARVASGLDVVASPPPTSTTCASQYESDHGASGNISTEFWHLPSVGTWHHHLPAAPISTTPSDDPAPKHHITNEKKYSVLEVLPAQFVLKRYCFKASALATRGISSSHVLDEFGDVDSDPEGPLVCALGHSLVRRPVPRVGLDCACPHCGGHVRDGDDVLACERCPASFVACCEDCWRYEGKSVTSDPDTTGQAALSADSPPP